MFDEYPIGYYFADSASFVGFTNDHPGYQNIVRIGTTIDETVSNLIHAINKNGCVAYGHTAGVDDVCMNGSDDNGVSYPTPCFSAAT